MRLCNTLPRNVQCVRTNDNARVCVHIRHFGLRSQEVAWDTKRYATMGNSMQLSTTTLSTEHVPVVPDNGRRETGRLNQRFNLADSRATKSSHSVVQRAHHEVLRVPEHKKPDDCYRAVKIYNNQLSSVFWHSWTTTSWLLNALPQNVMSLSSLTVFRKRLKTYLFSCSFH